MLKLHGGQIKLMNNCPKCGEAVREEKAFCHNCGSPMDAAKANRGPMPDFGATIIEPPRRAATTPVPPAIVAPPSPPPVAATPQPLKATQPTGTPAPAPVSPIPPRATSPTPPVAPQSFARPKSAWKIGVGFVLLLLFLMFIAFVAALWFN